MRSLRAMVAAIMLAVALPCAAAAGEISPCATRGLSLAGQLPSVVASTADKVYVMPQSATTDLYLNYLQLLYPGHPSIDSAVALLIHRGEFSDAAAAARAVMHAAPLDPAGRFRCGGLGRGAYRVLAFVRAGAAPGRSPQSGLTILFANAVTSDGTSTISNFSILGGTP